MVKPNLRTFSCWQFSHHLDKGQQKTMERSALHVCQFAVCPQRTETCWVLCPTSLCDKCIAASFTRISTEVEHSQWKGSKTCSKTNMTQFTPGSLPPRCLELHSEQFPASFLPATAMHHQSLAEPSSQVIRNQSAEVSPRVPGHCWINMNKQQHTVSLAEGNMSSCFDDSA